MQTGLGVRLVPYMAKALKAVNLSEIVLQDWNYQPDKMIFKWRRKIFGSFNRLDFLLHVYLRHNIFYFSCQMSQFQLLWSSVPPTLPQYNRFRIQHSDGITSSILADCFSGKTVDANGTDTKSSGGGIVQFLWHKFWYLISNHYLAALSFMSLKSSIVCAR